MKKALQVGIICLILGIGLIALGIVLKDSFIICLIGALLLIALGVWILKYYFTETRKDNQKLKEYASGNWTFPSDTFYDQCQKSSVKKMETAFEKEKAKALAAAIMSKEGVPEANQHLYLTEECLQKYFDEGKRNTAAAQKRKEETEEKRLTTPKRAIMFEDDTAELTGYQQLKEKTGKEKRELMCEILIRKYTSEIQQIKRRQNGMQDLAVNVMQSTSEKKTADTAITAGIANGIGGAGAALYATVDVMNRNAQIEAENRKNRETINQAATQMFRDSIPMGKKIEGLERSIDILRKQREELNTKIVVETGKTDELFRHLTVSNVQVKGQGPDALRISADLKTDYSPKGLPEGVRTVVDGTLTGKVYAGDLFVREIVLPLPVLGVECGSPYATTAETLCEYYSVNGKPYRVEFEPNDLWVMEL